jgi:hypothetical protein
MDVANQYSQEQLTEEGAQVQTAWFVCQELS